MITWATGIDTDGPVAQETATRLLSRDSQELARTLLYAANVPEEHSSALWQLVRGFHGLDRKQQAKLIVRSVKGFAAMPPEEQAEALGALAPKFRKVRRGWAKVPVKEGDWPPLVGAKGRLIGDTALVELLDAVDAALRQLQPLDRRKLHRSLDAAFTEEITPIVLARLLAALTAKQVKSLEDWVVEEGALGRDSAHRIFQALCQAGSAGEAALEARCRFAQLSLELSGDTWSLKNWLEGRSTSPTPSMRSTLDLGEEVSRSQTRRRSAGRALPNGGVYVANASADDIAESAEEEAANARRAAAASMQRASVRLHCPPEKFLFGEVSEKSSFSAVSPGVSANLALAFGL